jgi:hypothetical protein
MQPPFYPAGAIAARAQERDLGPRKAVYRRVRRIRPWVVLVLAIVVLIVALVIGLRIYQYAAAEALLVAFGAGVLVYRYAVPPQLVAAYEHGIVHAQGKEVRAARWEEIPFVWRGPSDLRLWLGDAEGQVTIEGFARQEELAAVIDSEVQPRALARADAQLRETGQAAFPPLTITQEGLQLTDRPPGPQAVAWSQVDSYARDGGRLVIDLAPPATPSVMPAPEWFDGLVANAIAAERLMDQTDPTTPPAVAAAQVAADVRAGRDLARARGRRVRVRAVLPSALALVVVLAGLGIVHGQSGQLDVVCHGQAAAGTAPYHGGQGPHPVDVEGDPPFGSAELLPPDLVPARRADVQLVACVIPSKTSSLVTTCQYYGAIGDMYSMNYTITLYAASTGKVLAGPTTVQGGDATCPDETLVGGGEKTVDLYSLLNNDQLLDVIGHYAGS